MIFSLENIMRYYHDIISTIYITDIFVPTLSVMQCHCNTRTIQGSMIVWLSDQIISKIHSVLQQKDDETFNSTLSTAGTDLHNTAYSVTRFYTRQKQSNTHTLLSDTVALLKCQSVSQLTSRVTPLSLQLTRPCNSTDKMQYSRMQRWTCNSL